MKNSSKKILIIGALDVEVENFIQFVVDLKKTNSGQFVFYEGILFGKNVVVAKSGIGKVFAAMTTQKLIDSYEPQFVIFTGVAGGLNKQYNVGDIIVARDCVQYDMDASGLGFPRGAIPYTDYRFWKTDDQLHLLAVSAKTDHKIHSGRIVTGDHFMTKSDLQDFDFLINELSGDAVEMEGAAVGQVCTLNEVPFLIIRTISDKADENASSDFNQFLPEVANNSYQIIKQILSKLA